MARQSENPGFDLWARRWRGYQARRGNRWRPLAGKAFFKLLYY